MLIRGKYFYIFTKCKRRIIGHFKLAEWLIIGMTNSEIINAMVMFMSKKICKLFISNFTRVTYFAAYFDN